MRGSVLALAAGLVIAGCGSSTGPSAPVATAAATTPTPAIASTPAASTATSPPVGGPLTTVAPGTYEVGTGNGQIAPGKYFAPAPTSTAPCYYALCVPETELKAWPEPPLVQRSATRVAARGFQ